MESVLSQVDLDIILINDGEVGEILTVIPAERIKDPS